MNVLKFSNRFLMMFLLVGVLSITVISASFSEKLVIDGDAYVRVDADIRITNLEMTSVTGSAYELYNCKYSKDSISIYPYLPSLSSTITYQITVTNKSSDLYIISAITNTTNSNANIVYTIDYTIGESISGNSTKVITITYKYKDGLTNLPSEKTTNSTIEFKFEKPTAVMLAYDNSKTGINCDNVQCALDFIKEIKK